MKIRNPKGTRKKGHWPGAVFLGLQMWCLCADHTASAQLDTFVASDLHIYHAETAVTAAGASENIINQKIIPAAFDISSTKDHLEETANDIQKLQRINEKNDGKP